MIFDVIRTIPAGALSPPLVRGLLRLGKSAETLGYSTLWLTVDEFDGQSRWELVSMLLSRTTTLNLGLVAPPAAYESDTRPQELRLLDDEQHPDLLGQVAQGRLRFAVRCAAGQFPAQAPRSWPAVVLGEAGCPAEPVFRACQQQRELHRRGAVPERWFGLVRQVVIRETADLARRGAESAFERADPTSLSTLLVGSPATIESEIRLLANRSGEQHQPGLDLLVLDFSVGNLDDRAAIAAMELFSRTVMPLFSPQPAMPPTLA